MCDPTDQLNGENRRFHLTPWPIAIIDEEYRVH